MVLGAVALVTGLTQQEQTTHVNHIVSLVEPHTENNIMFSELRAASLQALKAHTSEESLVEIDTEKPHRSPMAEVSALTDQMLIQTSNEIDVLVKTHKKFQRNCKRDMKKFSGIITDRKDVEEQNLESAMSHRRKWVGLLPEIPDRDRKMAQTHTKILAALDEMEALVAKAKKRHAKFLNVIHQHDDALNDVRQIRLIIQNSNLDNRSNKNGRVSAGKKSTSHHIKTLLEIKARSHERLHPLIDLSHRSMLQVEEGDTSGIDMIYKLIYKTRDSLLESKQKAIKSEHAANTAWRTNKIGFQNDINDLRILKATYYKEKGTVKLNIGNHKKIEGDHKLIMGKAIKVKEDHIILKKFLHESCKEEARVFSTNLATKKGEKEALEKVQKKLVSLKWSNKVYKAIQHVTEGITFLRGEYNIRCAIGGYIAVDKKEIYCHNRKDDDEDEKWPYGKFVLHMQKKDLSYHIVIKNKKGVHTFLTMDPDTNEVEFEPTPNKYSRWDFEYVAKTGEFHIKNKVTGQVLTVDQKKDKIINTKLQFTDNRAQFNLERISFTEVGCFKNKVGKQLQYYAGGFSNLNADMCYKKCAARAKKKGASYDYFGLSEGKQCFCGTDFDREKAPAAECGILCPGRSGESCGGQFRSRIFKMKLLKKPLKDEDNSGDE